MKDRIATLYRQLSACTLCHGEGGIFVPEPSRVMAKGEQPRVLVLGEHPDSATCRASGKTGLDQKDPCVIRLRSFLQQATIDESDIFYATAVMCLPRDAALRGARPSAKETRNCTKHVRTLVDLLRPRVIVPVGHTAIQSIQWVFDDWPELGQFILNYDVGNVLERKGLTVYPLYHTSTATLGARSQDRQEKDWRRLALILDSLGSKTPSR